MKEFGHEYFMVFPNKHMQGQNKCPFENKSKETKHTDQDLEDMAKNFTSTNEFKKMSNSEWNAAIKRGNEFYKRITSHFTPSSESAGEKIVTKILIDNNLIPEKQKTFEGCVNKKEGRYCKKLTFDFYIPSLNTVVEYDGEQHFRPSDKFGGKKFETTVENDLIKNNYCKDKGIKLVRIPYNMKGNLIEEELIKALSNQEPFQLLGDYPTKGWNAE
jgi:very-short-patch-repair endonuclease